MAPAQVRIVWTKRAEQHLRDTYRYWSHEKSEAAADIMLERILSIVELLEHNPELGRPGREATSRELILKPLPFVLAYRVTRNKIEVVALLHGARKWPEQI
jgi:toxin ParE1/3/4